MKIETIHHFRSAEAAHHFECAQWWADVAESAKARGLITAQLAADDWADFHVRAARAMESELATMAFCTSKPSVA